ncbi:hypothetical protein LH392_09450 [Corynebacterium uberis]|uniref:hypothetical protein n=1 Tax=Corynebacterium TaxID=1716 RepID=UPI001D0AA6F9|nr:MULTISPECIES: hypothetical protein [Corynebacterium]MCZ9310352.1 hypothetical protein [Corynebacterium sp. c6VSa_13]UDL73732.1 hypothetical protein LH391_00370 [Corynebacterium uberis]UDL75385.1 hypothetical protein LH393_09035 [Corynebacterium uberis]UDL77597.1 hypothetical protein LH394_09020 [Corynebacterium uberis]UDL79883.1 hypothetical protein LH392_09450 [Corynebacterium uberis]
MLAVKYKPSWIPSCVVATVSVAEDQVVCRSRYEALLYLLTTNLEMLCLISWIDLSNAVLAELVVLMRIGSVILLPPVLVYIYRTIFLKQFRNLYILIGPGKLEITGGRKLKQLGPIDNVKMGEFMGAETIHIGGKFVEENFFYFSFRGKKRLLDSFMLNPLFIPANKIGTVFELLRIPDDE